LLVVVAVAADQAAAAAQVVSEALSPQQVAELLLNRLCL
jgi:hypothetical protein